MLKRWHMELIPQDKTIKKNNVIFTTPNSLIVGKIRNFHMPISIDKSKITKKRNIHVYYKNFVIRLLDQRYTETIIWAKKRI